MVAKFKITSFNVRGLGNPIKHRRVVTSLARTKSQIIFLQEIHTKDSNIDVLKANWTQSQYHAAGISKSRGVAILITKDIPFQHKKTLRDPKRRFTFIKGSTAEQKYTFASLYAPNEHQLSFIKESREKLTQFQEGHLIAGGDLNYIIDYKLQKET